MRREARAAVLIAFVVALAIPTFAFGCDKRCVIGNDEEYGTCGNASSFLPSWPLIANCVPARRCQPFFGGEYCTPTCEGDWCYEA